MSFVRKIVRRDDHDEILEMIEEQCDGAADEYLRECEVKEKEAKLAGLVTELKKDVLKVQALKEEYERTPQGQYEARQRCLIEMHNRRVRALTDPAELQTFREVTDFYFEMDDFDALESFLQAFSPRVESTVVLPSVIASEPELDERGVQRAVLIEAER